MTVSEEKISGDLKRLTAECNRLADEACIFDPLLEIVFSFKTEQIDEGACCTVVIDRNSGGSPESDYAIQDEATVLLNKQGDIRLSFFMEMAQQDTVSVKRAGLNDWEELLIKIRAFCTKNIPAL